MASHSVVSRAVACTEELRQQVSTRARAREEACTSLTFPLLGKCWPAMSAFRFPLAVRRQHKGSCNQSLATSFQSRRVEKP